MKKTTIILLSVLIGSSVNAQTWSQKANVTSAARYYGTGFTIGHYAFVGCGSNNGTSTHYNDFYKWNQTTNTWSAIASYPGAGYQYTPIGFSIEGKGYVGLGWNGSGGSQDLWRYDSGTNAWTQMASLPGAGRYDESVFVLGHKAYIITGSAGGPPYLDDIWMYDAHTNSWKQMNNSPAGNEDGVAAFSIGNHAYIAGGWDGTNTHNGAWEYDSTNDSWMAIANFPITMAGSQAFVIGSKGYVCSGSETVSNDLAYGYLYDTITKAWTIFTNMGANGLERIKSVVLTIGNYGYVATGQDSIGNYLNILWQYYPCSDTLLGINDIVNASTERVNLYPNPSNGNLHISYSGLHNIKTDMLIIDMMGRSVKDIELKGYEGSIQVDATYFDDGIYFYRVSSGNDNLNGKFIIAK